VHPEGGVASPRHVGEDALRAQAAADGRRHAHIVLDQQQAHSSMMILRMRGA
jgi:hypothetical protein